MIVGRIVDGAYKALYGDVPKRMLPSNRWNKGKRDIPTNPGQRQRFEYKVFVTRYTQLGYSGKTFKQRKTNKGRVCHTMKVIKTRGRCFRDLEKALKRFHYLTTICANTDNVVLIRLHESQAEKQVLQRKLGERVKK